MILFLVELTNINWEIKGLAKDFPTEIKTYILANNEDEAINIVLYNLIKDNGSGISEITASVTQKVTNIIKT